MMPPPGLQIHLYPHVTLNFDLLTPEVDRFMPSPRGPLVPIGIKVGLVYSFSNYHVHMFGNRQTNGQTDERTG